MLSYRTRLVITLTTPLLFWILCSTFNLTHCLEITIFLTSCVFWIFQLLEFYKTTILILISALVLKLLTASEIIDIFLNDVIVLLFAIFIMIYALEKHSCGQTVVNKLMQIKFLQGSLYKFSLLVMLLSFFLSMFYSNTATCAILLPICLSLIKSIDNQFGNNLERAHTTNHLLLLCTYSASIGGIATPIGSPPNLLAIGFLEKNHIHVGFFEWCIYGIPLAFALLLIMHAVLSFTQPLVRISNLKFDESITLKNSSFSVQQYQAIIIFLLAIITWLIPDILNLFSSNTIRQIKGSININYILVFISLLLFIIPSKYNQEGIKPNLELKELRCIDWNTLFLFIGGIALGTLLSKSGLTSDLAEFITNYNLSTWILFALLTLLAVITSEFISNTASVATLAPLVFLISPDPNYTFIFIFALTISASLGFMLPMSTVPNALVYSTKRISMGTMIKTGFILDLLGWLVVTIILLMFL